MSFFWQKYILFCFITEIYILWDFKSFVHLQLHFFHICCFSKKFWNGPPWSQDLYFYSNNTSVVCFSLASFVIIMFCSIQKAFVSHYIFNVMLLKFLCFWIGLTVTVTNLLLLPFYWGFDMRREIFTCNLFQPFNCFIHISNFFNIFAIYLLHVYVFTSRIFHLRGCEYMKLLL